MINQTKLFTMGKLWLLVFATFMATTLKAQKLKDELQHTEKNFHSIQKVADEYFKKKSKDIKSSQRPDEEELSLDKEYNKYMRWAWFWRDRVLPDGSFPDLLDQQQAVQKKASKNKRSGDPNWINISQKTSTGGYSGMGRTTAIAFDPVDANTFYVGAPIGGIWKTTDGGLNYHSLGDNLPYLGVGDILVDRQNRNHLYISLGDDQGWWNPNLGIYKSTDGGASWNPTSLSWSFNDNVAVYRMVMSPLNTSVILVATSNGLYRTNNAGSTWTKVMSGAWNDVDFRPGDDNVVYAAKDDYWGTSQVYKSTNGGVSWAAITSFNEQRNKITIFTSEANPDKVGLRFNVGNKYYYSFNNGSSFTYGGTFPEGGIVYYSQKNANVIYNGWMNVHKSDNNGQNWTKMTHWYNQNPYQEVHADQRDINHHPLNHNLIYFCNDGGIYQLNEQTQKFTDYSNGLLITQFYKIAVAQSDATLMIGGTQDNGGRKRTGANTWEATNGGDAMEVAIDPTNANILYTTYVDGQLYRSTDQWVRDTYKEITPPKPTNVNDDRLHGAWVTPYVLDPNNSSVIVAGYHEVYRSTDRGNTWTVISNNLTGGYANKLEAIAVAPSNSNVIYTSKDNKLYRTVNLGSSWASYTLPNNERITSLAIHPTNPNILWAARSNYNAGNKVFRSDNGGASWTNVSGNLPNVPVNCIIYENGSNDRLYVGTDAGIYYRDNSTSDWVQYGNGLPNTAVMDLEIRYSSKTLYAGTHGRGIFEIPTVSNSVATCIAPPNVITTNITSNAVTVQWEAVSNASYYYIYYIKAGDTNWTLVNNLQTTSHTLSNLASNTNYTVDIWVACKNGEYKSSRVSVTTKAAEGIVADGYYKIKARHSGKLVDVSGASLNNGANIHQWTDFNANNQIWKLEFLGNNQYKIIAKHSNKVMDAQDGGTQAGTNVQQWPWNESNAQRWIIEPSTNGYVKIKNVHSNLYLDVAGTSYANGGNILLWSGHGGANQQWQLIPIAESSVYHLPEVSQNGGITPETPLTLYPNPTASEVTVKFLSTENKEIEIALYDLKGVKIFGTLYTSATGENHVKLALPENIRQGMFIVKVDNQHKMLIIQK